MRGPSARLSLPVIADRGAAGQCGKHTSTQELVLLATSPRSIWWPLLHLTAGNDFAQVELVSGEVDVAAIGQPIPVMVADLGLINEDLAEDQVASEQVVDDQGGYSALTPGRVVWPPVLQVVRVTGVRPPGGSQYRPQQFRVQHPRTSMQVRQIDPDDRRTKQAPWEG
jgi:hypothetical protein